MERKEMISILNGMCERCLIRGLVPTLDEAKTLYEVFERFSERKYTNDGEYSADVLYLYNLGVKLHESGNTSLEESYSIYNAILCADRIDFIETNEIVQEKVVKNDVVKIKRKKV